MKKRMIIGIMACAALITGCSVGKNNNILENGNIDEEVTDSVEQKETSTDIRKKIEIIDGEYVVDKETFKFDNENFYGISSMRIYKRYDEHDYDYVTCDEYGIFMCNVQKRKQEQLESEFQDLSDDELTEEQKYAREHFGYEKILDEKNCRNLFVYDDKVYFLTEKNKVKVYNLDSKKCDEIDELKEFDIDSMYVINDSSICFNVKDIVYQYKIGDEKVVRIKNIKHLFEFIPTRFGVLYVVNNDEKNDMYANDVKILESIDDYVIRNQLRKVDNKCIYDGKDEMIYYDKDYKDYEYKLEDAFNATGIVEGKQID